LFQILVPEDGTMKSQIKPYPLIDTLINTFDDWLSCRREKLDVCRYDADEFAHIARDLAVAPGDLDALVRHGPHAADELPKLLKALGIDEKTIARTHPLALRDMERVCSSCAQKRLCNNDLAVGHAVQCYEEYCGNAPTIVMLAQG
jgi:hypothetical protein